MARAAAVTVLMLRVAEVYIARCCHFFMPLYCCRFLRFAALQRERCCCCYALRLRDGC